MADEKKKKIEEDESWGQGSMHILTNKGLFPVSVLKVNEKAKATAHSKQLKEEGLWLSTNDLVPYPFEASTLLELKDNCSYFDSCVKQIAKDVMGQGWRLELKEGKKESNAEKDQILEFIENSGGDRDETFEETLERGLIDWGLIDWSLISHRSGVGGGVRLVLRWVDGGCVFRRRRSLLVRLLSCLLLVASTDHHRKEGHPNQQHVPSCHWSLPFLWHQGQQPICHNCWTALILLNTVPKLQSLCHLGGLNSSLNHSSRAPAQVHPPAPGASLRCIGDASARRLRSARRRTARSARKWNSKRAKQ